MGNRGVGVIIGIISACVNLNKEGKFCLEAAVCVEMCIVLNLGDKVVFADIDGELVEPSVLE